jgi:hypothetical protein
MKRAIAAGIATVILLAGCGSQADTASKNISKVRSSTSSAWPFSHGGREEYVIMRRDELERLALRAELKNSEG